jgi:prephenate dehydrogenase
MGASLSLTIRAKGFPCKTTGIVRTEKSKTKGLELKSADIILTEEEFLQNPNWNEFDLVVFSLPIHLTCEKILAFPENYCGVITDLASAKKDIIEIVEKKFQTTHSYYSSHPMAGSEQTGLEFAKPNLFEGKLCILTKPKQVSSVAIEKLELFWKQLDTSKIEMNSIEHDQILAYLSHSPHILSSILVNWAYENPIVQNKINHSDTPLTGGGFRDMTRIAGSNPEMWDAIISANKQNIIDSLEGFKSHIDSILKVLNDENTKSEFWNQYFTKSKSNRANILKLKE